MMRWIAENGPIALTTLLLIIFLGLGWWLRAESKRLANDPTEESRQALGFRVLSGFIFLVSFFLMIYLLKALIERFI